MRIILSEHMSKLLFENTMGLPKNILKQLVIGTTSLSKHPSFPPDMINPFEIDVLSNYYEIIQNNVLNIAHTIEPEFINNLVVENWDELLQYESENSSELEMLVMKIIKEIFSISNEDVEFECVISNEDVDDRNDIPSDDIFQFNDINELELINKLIYKKRLLNSIIAGLSTYLTIQSIDNHIRDLFQINPDLPKLYTNLLLYNEFLMYHYDTSEKGSSYNINIIPDSKPQIKVCGNCFIGLLHDAIKSIFDYIVFKSIENEIVDNENKNEVLSFILSKSDFKEADLWDSRFGLPLITNIISIVPTELLPYVFKELINTNIDEFNENIKEIFIDSKRGNQILEDYVDDVSSGLRYGQLEQDIDMKRQEFEKSDIYFDINDL